MKEVKAATTPKEPDLTDRRILYYLDRNARIPLSALSKKTGISKESAHYRIRNLRKRGYISKFYTIINTSKLGYYFFKVYLQLQNFTEKAEKAMMEYLQSHPRYSWSCFCSGRWDMLIGVWAEDPLDLDDAFLADFLGRFSDCILAKEMSITKHNFQQARRWFYKAEDEPATSHVGGKAEKVPLDETDREILRIIANNARLPVTRIAKMAKTTPAVVRHRMKSMEKSGIIVSYRISFDLNRYGYEFCKSFVYLGNVKPKRMEEFHSYCRYHENILNFITLFGSWDMEMEFEVPNFEYFHSAMREMRNKFGDIVKSYDSVLISREYKVDYMPGCYPPLEDEAETIKKKPPHS